VSGARVSFTVVRHEQTSFLPMKQTKIIFLGVVIINNNIIPINKNRLRKTLQAFQNRLSTMVSDGFP
jgi:hypothetical protein